MLQACNPSKVLKVVSLIFAALGLSVASANTQLCLKKEISSDGVTWYDANTEVEAVVINSDAFFRFTAYKCPDAFGGLYGIVLTDPQIGVAVNMEDLPSDESDFTPSVYETVAANYCDGYEGTIENVATVEGWSMISDTIRIASDNAWARCESVPQGGEGCTPGYWKQTHHLDSWPVSETTLFSEVFDRVITIRLKRQGEVTDPTLFEALAAKGGKVNTAARHATAAYLNALSAGVSFDMTTDGVIDAFQTSYDNNDYGPLIQSLVDFNEQGCPLN
ncbi:hypothetical protein [Pleionea sediminis]|uniref:hypothetical protein n=1 Tax=Pleionea sediminis TaxID=2569479 RepID=UPI0011867500|nr:hypothetical protein [Pleionea sediminis]